MRIVACGDAMFSSRNLARRLDRRLVDLLGQADACFANAEFCCPRPDRPPAPRRFITSVRAQVLDEFCDLNIRLLSFANNHAGDFGPQGVIDTLEAAEARKLLPGGIGRNLYEARSARFLDTPKGRIGLVAASTTRAVEFAASVPGNGMAARAGLNPLRFGRAYVLPDEAFRQMARIDEMLGTAASRREVMGVEVMRDPGPDAFAFGSVFEGSLRIERGERAGVRYFVDERDAKAVLANIGDAAKRSDCVLFSLHTHEGEAENWYAPRPAAFVEDFARRAIDAGAHAVLCHGAHMLRGVQVHRGRPIFYNLASLVMEFEAGEQLMTPEMYEGFGFGVDAVPSQLHGARVQDEQGRRIGFYAERRFSDSCLAVCDFDGGEVKVELLPIDLDLNRARPAERGLPAWPSPQLGRAIAEQLARLSQYWGTRLTYDEARGTIAVSAP
jgi:poly-gamma-glutamate capsule biosynthesis protein CapA/YwtB (metallophosphatase superfamily)